MGSIIFSVPSREAPREIVSNTLASPAIAVHTHRIGERGSERVGVFEDFFDGLDQREGVGAHDPRGALLHAFHTVCARAKNQCRSGKARRLFLDSAGIREHEC